MPVKQPKSYVEVQREMRQSTFCLLPPGDTSSSNRLTEVILAGCIPVVRLARCWQGCFGGLGSTVAVMQQWQLVASCQVDELLPHCQFVPASLPTGNLRRSTKRSLLLLNAHLHNCTLSPLFFFLLPQFIGHPWHEMPFNHGEVDYASMSVFLNITNASWLGTQACVTNLRIWQQMADVGWATAAVPDMQAALAYLRAMPREAVQRRQAALERERPKLYYGPAPGSRTSALADIVFTNLLDYGHRVAAGELNVTAS
jgi:hypothetical protein